MIDKNLFIYLTKKAGFSMEDVAARLDLSLSGVYKRVSGEVEFRRDEMEAWMALVGVKDAGPVFFPGLVTEKRQPSTREEAEACGL